MKNVEIPKALSSLQEAHGHWCRRGFWLFTKKSRVTADAGIEGYSLFVRSVLLKVTSFG